MIIRGICCLIAGIPGQTENITIRSIVGRYLEHTRIYIFGAGNQADVYIASADWMTRNTIRRVEVGAPIYDKDIKSRILSMFQIMMQDNVKARIQQPDGSYKGTEQCFSAECTGIFLCTGVCFGKGNCNCGNRSGSREIKIYVKYNALLECVPVGR